MVVTAKRRRLRESPLLQPLARKRVPTASTPSPPKLTKSGFHLSKDTQRKWLLEALETMDTTSLSLRLEEELANSPLHIRSVETASIEDSPVVATSSENVLTNTLPSREEFSVSQSSIPSPKRSPGCEPVYSCLPLYGRQKSTRSPLKLPLKSSPPKISSRFSIAPLISREMLVKLQAHLEDKIRGDIWQNEVRSRLARPLSATIFSNRDEQLDHALASSKFIAHDSNQRASTPLYPYSQEAHDLTRRMDRMYLKHCFRRDILAAVRRLAIAIRYFRRVIIPWLIKAFRRRRCAAIMIQRRLRRHFHWKRTVLHPFAVRFVANVLKRGCLLVKARFVFSTKLRQLVQDRKAREVHARERRRVLFRWVAKTRVALFVHMKWCVDWFRRKREHNLAKMRLEVQQLEDSDKAVQTEYATIFSTAFGRKLLKKELTQWRQSIKTRPTTGMTAAGSSGEDVPPSDTVVRLRQCFNIFDLDGSGTLDLEEFELMLAYLRSSLIKNANTKETKRAKLTTAQVRDLFETLDVDGNGKVTCDEFQAWWTGQHSSANTEDVASGSASVTLLSTGLDRLVLTGHGLLFWLLGKKQQLENKFVKKLLIKNAQDSAKRVLLEQIKQDESTADDTKRCGDCARCYGLRRDLNEHAKHYCPSRDAPSQWVVDTFIWRKWIREEELRLLEDEESEKDEQANDSNEGSRSTSEKTDRPVHAEQ